MGWFERFRGSAPRQVVTVAAADAAHELGPKIVTVAAADDGSILGPPLSGKGAWNNGGGPVTPANNLIIDWFRSFGPLGWADNAVLAQHWLIGKACSMPAVDAVRNGYQVDASPELAEKIQRADQRMKISQTLRDYVTFGRVFGIRIAVHLIDGVDTEAPLNLDGVMPGAYRGITQVDPQWCVPELSTESMSDPGSPDFYRPVFYRIGSRRYHRSHLSIWIPYPVAKQLAPMYLYGGASLPQKILSRVYAAERTADEAPQLAMTKRLNVLKVDTATADPDSPAFLQRILQWVGLRDNYGVQVVDKDSEDVAQIDTSLSDMDDLIMTQYQLVASVAEMPATKLLETQPKGFNTTGEFESKGYRETLETIQSDGMSPLLYKHHAILARSLGHREEVGHTWEPTDSPTAKEWAELNKTKAETDQIYIDAGVLDGHTVLGRLRQDKTSDYFGLPDEPLIDAPDPAAP